MPEYGEADPHWVTVYTTYINAGRSCSQGRKVPREVAVDNPTPRAVMEALRSSTALNYAVELKAHPKYFWEVGRVRVDLKDKNTGMAKDPRIQSRDALLRHICQHYKAPAVAQPAPKKPSKKSKKKRKK